MTTPTMRTRKEILEELRKSRKLLNSKLFVQQFSWNDLYDTRILVLKWVLGIVERLD